MDMNYDILSYDELPADEAAMLKADAEEAERGYTDEQLSEALKRTPGRPLAVGSTPASFQQFHVLGPHAHRMDERRPLDVSATTTSSGRPSGDIPRYRTLRGLQPVNLIACFRLFSYGILESCVSGNGRGVRASTSRRYGSGVARTACPSHLSAWARAR